MSAEDFDAWLRDGITILKDEMNAAIASARAKLARSVNLLSDELCQRVESTLESKFGSVELAAAWEVLDSIEQGVMSLQVTLSEVSGVMEAGAPFLEKASGVLSRLCAFASDEPKLAKVCRGVLDIVDGLSRGASAVAKTCTAGAVALDHSIKSLVAAARRTLTSLHEHKLVDADDKKNVINLSKFVNGVTTSLLASLRVSNDTVQAAGNTALPDSDASEANVEELVGVSAVVQSVSTAAKLAEDIAQKAIDAAARSPADWFSQVMNVVSSCLGHLGGLISSQWAVATGVAGDKLQTLIRSATRAISEAVEDMKVAAIAQLEDVAEALVGEDQVDAIESFCGPLVAPMIALVGDAVNSRTAVSALELWRVREVAAVSILRVADAIDRVQDDVEANGNELGKISRRIKVTRDSNPSTARSHVSTRRCAVCSFIARVRRRLK